MPEKVELPIGGDVTESHVVPVPCSSEVSRSIANARTETSDRVATLIDDAERSWAEKRGTKELRQILLRVLALIEDL